MKIRHKQTGDVVEASPLQNDLLRKVSQLGGRKWVFLIERKRSGTYDERESNP